MSIIGSGSGGTYTPPNMASLLSTAEDAFSAFSGSTSILRRGGVSLAAKFIPFVNTASLLYDAYSLFKRVSASTSVVSSPVVNTPVSTVVDTVIFEASNNQVSKMASIGEFASSQPARFYETAQGATPNLLTVMQQNSSLISESINANTLVLANELGQLNLSLTGLLAYFDLFYQIKSAANDVEMYKSGLEISNLLGASTGATSSVISLPESLNQYFTNQNAIQEIKTAIANYQKAKLEYETTVQVLRDMDGNILGSYKPIEAKAVNYATTARKHTDENNFELDDDDFLGLPDLSSLFVFKGAHTINQEVFGGGS